MQSGSLYIPSRPRFRQGGRLAGFGGVIAVTTTQLWRHLVVMNLDGRGPDSGGLQDHHEAQEGGS
jgi:hypothetical protein